MKINPATRRQKRVSNNDEVNRKFMARYILSDTIAENENAYGAIEHAPRDILQVKAMVESAGRFDS